MKINLLIATAAMLVLGTGFAPNSYAGAEAKCKACHDFGAAHKVGPGLKGMFGMAAGSTDFAKYGDDLKKGGWNWDEEHLRKWITDSKAAIKEFSGNDGAKTKMPAQKLTGDKLDEVIAFMKGNK